MIDPHMYSSNTKVENKVKKLICIQGNIGAGKTKFMTLLKQKVKELNNILGYNCFFVDEPVKEWKEKILENNTLSPLGLFYQDIQNLKDGKYEKSKVGFSFQIYAFTTRRNSFLKETSKLNELSIGISERSMRSDYLFFENLYRNNLVSEFDWKNYNSFYKLICGTINDMEEIIIYIKSTPEECLTKIQSRGNGEELSIDLSYLVDIHNLHENMIKDFKGKVLILDWPYSEEKELIKIVDNFIENQLKINI
jgi:deoxyadenosine/deoxycytidine kinase